MYALTIDDNGADTLTLHATPAAAHRSLRTYLKLADYIYRPARIDTARTAYELLTAADRLRIVGAAIIEPYTDLDMRRDRRCIVNAALTPHRSTAGDISPI